MKSSSKKIIAVLLAMVMLLGLFTGCGTTKEAEEKKGPETQAVNDGTYNVDNMETLNLKLASTIKEAQFKDPGYCGATKYFADEVAKRSNGKVKVTIYAGGQLASNGDDYISGLNTGAFEFCIATNGVLGEFTDAFMEFNIPFLFNNWQEADEYLASERGEAIKKQMSEELDIKILTFFNQGPRVVTSKKPIHSAADVKGIKIRTQGDPYQMAPFDAMGAAVTTIPYAELYSALQQGVIDAQENPINNNLSQKFYEVCPYTTLTNHFMSICNLLVDENAFNSWSQDVQNLILEVAADAGKVCTEGNTTKEEAEFKKIEECFTEVYYPSEEEMQSFRDATASCWDAIKEQMGDARYNAVMSQIEAIRSK